MQSAFFVLQRNYISFKALCQEEFGRFCAPRHPGHAAAREAFANFCINSFPGGKNTPVLSEAKGGVRMQNERENQNQRDKQTQNQRENKNEQRTQKENRK